MTTEQDKTISALKTSIQMEIDGKEFYQKASQTSRNELGKKLLKQLSAEEDIHRQVFEKIYDDYSATESLAQDRLPSRWRPGAENHICQGAGKAVRCHRAVD